MNTLNTLALASMIGCSDYALNPTKGQDTGFEDQDTGVQIEDTSSEDTATKDSEDTGDTEETKKPTVTLKTALNACLQLDSSACQWNASEGGPDSACVSDAEARKAALEARVVAEAQEVSGDNTLTLEEIKDGAVPATVYAYYALDESRLSGTPVWANYAYIDVAFGDTRTEMLNRDFPFESPGVDSLRCNAYSYSYEVDEDPSAVSSWTPIENASYWSEADGTTPEDSQMNIIDFRNYGSGSTVVEINGAQLDSSDSNLNFTTTGYALEDANEDVLSTAQLYTGVTGADIKTEVITY